MSSALIVEDGSGVEDADSYESLANATLYFTEQRGKASDYEGEGDWLHTDTTDEDRKGCLRLSTSLIDERWAFNGSKVNSGESYRKFPRSGLLDDEGEEIASDIVPKKIKRACVEFARVLMLDIDRLSDQEVGLSSLDVDVIGLVFNQYDRPSSFPASVQLLLSDFAVSKSGRRGREIVRA